jgi:diaminopimelate epimerase
MSLPFLKMHGLGNDFVVIDARRAPLTLKPAQRRLIADRKRGVGCDQLILIEPAVGPGDRPGDSGATAFMRIYNPDGSESGACGNATRCVASLLMREGQADGVLIRTVAGLLDCRPAPGGLVTVDMGPARLDWRDIPLAEPMDTLRLDLRADGRPGGLEGPCAVGMGNPHAVFFVDDAEAVPLAELGPLVEHHPLFPERTNVEVAQVLSPGEIRLRVWERGAGITQACGSGACATAVAAARRGLTGRRALVRLDGGTLELEWREDGHVMMTGPVATSFSGTLDTALLRDDGDPGREPAAP